MQLEKEKISIMAKEFLQSTKQYKEIEESVEQENYEICCILLKGSVVQPYDILVYAEYEDEVLCFNPLEKEGYVDHSFSFHFDSELFRPLEKGYQILSMTDECHYDVWSMLGEYADEKVLHKQEFKRYLEYCKRNGITKEYLQTKTSYDERDITELYEKKVGVKGRDRALR